MNTSRRNFIKSGLVVSGAGILTHPVSLPVAAAAGTDWKVGVIGHTGRGNYGHGLDTAWIKRKDVSIAGVADPHPDGLARATQRLGLKSRQGFKDYHQMLEQLKPQLVAICPRHPDQHAAMCLAAIKNGARGIYIEKPFLRTPAEVDSVLAAAAETGTRIAIAHRNRYHPVIHWINEHIHSGGIGRILEIRGRGKGDSRGGGEDLWVLGTHVLNLIAYFAGAPETCSASIYNNGKSSQVSDIVDGNEALGLIVGNELHARYRHASGLTSYFDSIANDGTRNHGFGLNIVGSEATIRIFNDRDPVAYYQKGNPLSVDGSPRSWLPISTQGVGKPETNQELIQRVMHHDVTIDDLIHSISTESEPMCSGREGGLTVEMVHAVFASHFHNGANVKIPLVKRDHALNL